MFDVDSKPPGCGFTHKTKTDKSKAGYPVYYCETCGLTPGEVKPTECPAMKAGAEFIDRFQAAAGFVELRPGELKPEEAYKAHGDKAKPSFNPKDSVGIAKVPLSTVPVEVILEVGLAMLEGARKYGRHNYFVIPVMASTYYDAVMARHMPAWWFGEDIDADSGLSHITKAIASLVVLRAAMIHGTFMDDRPPRAPVGYIANMNAKAAEIIKKYPEPVPAYTEAKHGDAARAAAEALKETP